MIQYKCTSCGARLETDDALSGGNEACPDCGTVNQVPLSKAARAAQRERRAERLRQEQAQWERGKEQRRRELEADAQAQEEVQRQRLAEELARQRVLQQQEEQEFKERLGESLHSPTKVDRFLWMCFRFAKMISAGVVGVCLAVTIGCLLGLMVSQLRIPSVPQPSKVLPPQFSVLRESLSRSASPARPAAKSAEPATPADLVRSFTVPSHEEALLASLMRQYAVDPTFAEQLLSWLQRLESEYRKPLVDGLTAFLAEYKQFMSQTPARVTTIQAISWYRDQYLSAIQATVQAEAQAHAARTAAAAQATAIRATLLTVAVGAVVTMLSFLVLPLLIQIEQNTRILRIETGGSPRLAHESAPGPKDDSTSADGISGTDTETLPLALSQPGDIWASVPEAPRDAARRG